MENDLNITMVTSKYGLGHVTRQLALIKELLQLDVVSRIKLVLADNNFEILKNSFPKVNNLTFESLPITPSIAINDWNRIDVESTIYSFQMFSDFDTQIRNDAYWGRVLTNTDILVNDIESIHNQIATRMDIYTVNISNFTWSDILFNLGASELSGEVAKFEQMADINLQLPFNTTCIGFGGKYLKTGLLVNTVLEEEIKVIRESYDDQKLIFVNLPGNIGRINRQEFIQKLIRSGFTPMFVEQDINRHISKLAKSKQICLIPQNSTEFQSYIFSADLFFGKIGYSSVAESYSSGIPFIHTKRINYIEDERLSQQIIADGRGKLIDQTSDIPDLIQDVEDYLIFQLSKFENANKKIAKTIINEYDKTV